MNHFPLTKKTLPSGLRTILLPREDMASVTFMVLIGVGSRYETVKQWGLSHFLEHMFFKGTTTRPTTKEIAEAIDNIGGEFNAFTGEEYTGYYVKVAADYLEKGAEVVADILLRPLFPPEEIERERGVIIEEIRMYTDSPMQHVRHLWSQVLFGDHPLGRRIDGRQETVSTLKRPDFLAYTQKHYHTENAIVAVAGKFNQAKAQKLLAKLFAPLPVGSETFPSAAPRRVPHQKLFHERRGHIDQTHLIVGVPGLSLASPRRWAAEVLATILGAGMSSRLFLKVRERHGLAYAVRTSTDNYTDAGSFATQAGLRTDKAALGLKLIQEEYDRVMAEPVAKSELQKAKRMIRGHMLLELEETNALTVYAGGQELLQKNILTPAKILKKIDAITADDVQEVAQELLVPAKRAVALLSPHKSTKEFEKLL